MKRLITLIFFASLISSIAQESATTGEKTKTKEAEKKSLPEQLLGHWIVDEKVLLKKMRIAAEKGSRDGLTPEVESRLKEQAAKMSKMMAMEFTKGSTTMHTISGKKEGAYEVISSDPKTGELEVDVTGAEDDKNAVEKGTFTIEKDTLRLRAREAKAGDPNEVALIRIDAKKFREHVAGIGKLREKRKTAPTEKKKK